MSFSRLNYDDGTYKTNLRQSVGVGDYMLNTPVSDCRKCFPNDPMIMAQFSGVSTCADKPLVDVDSEMLNITRRASKCPAESYTPDGGKFCKLSHTPVNCPQMPREDTRISNPPCTLRSTGWNRWEWLCQDPQAKALMPFDYNISYRLIAKDNHRPCLPTPIDPVQVLPREHFNDAMTVGDTPCGKQNTDIPSTHWRTCKTYAPYGM